MAAEVPPGQIQPVYDVAGSIVGRQAYQYVMVPGVGRCTITIRTDELHPPDPINIKVFVTPMEGRPAPGVGYRSIEYDDPRFSQLNSDVHEAFDAQRFLSPQMAIAMAQTVGIPLGPQLLDQRTRGH